MSTRVELWKSKLPDSREARLERYLYSDGSLHWHFRDRMGHPYTPANDGEVEKIKKNWMLEQVEI